MEDPYEPPASPPQLPPTQASNIGDNAGVRMLIPVGRSGWAIAAGYLGLFAFLILPAPLALLVSLVAIFDIRKSKGSGKPKHGMGRAIFGLIIGALGTFVLIIALVSSLITKN